MLAEIAGEYFANTFNTNPRVPLAMYRAVAGMPPSLRGVPHLTRRISMQPIDYLSFFGVTSLNSPVAKSKTNPRIATFEGIHGCDLSFSTCFCVARSTSE